MFLAVAALAFATPALAHNDPAGCSATGVSIEIRVFRADGITGVVGSVSECENIQYQAVLAKSSAGACAFSGGTFTLTTPDGVPHTISSDVPCIGGTTSPCTLGNDSLTSGLFPYTVKLADISGGFVTANANYTGGFAHDNEPDTAGVSGSTPKNTPAVLCTDNNACTNDLCDPNLPGSSACSHTDIPCTDNNACTVDTCNPATGVCSSGAPKTCTDNNACTTDTCNTTTGNCEFSAPKTCTDNNACTTDTCNTTTGNCEFGTPTDCNDNNACTEDSCNTGNGVCQHTNPPSCDDQNACTTDSCNTTTGNCEHTAPPDCDDQDSCTADSCNTSTGNCEHGAPQSCDDSDPCTEDSCDGSGPEPVCVNTIISPPPAECAPTGCRLTGGGIVGPGGDETQGFAEIARGTFGGQVGAPCGCIGCFGNDFERIQGNWQYSRKGRKGNFHAMQFDSLVCGCDDGVNPVPLLDGKLCGNREIGPEPRRAPANVACFTGIGEISPENLGKRTQIVAYRVQIEDRGEPGAGKNSGALDDVMHIRIWVPGQGETAEGLATAACCLTPEASLPNVIRPPDIDDGGTLTHGNLQIHPELPKTLQGICPPPAGSCSAGG